VKNTIKYLLENGCSSIKYRVRHEILGESKDSEVLKALKINILDEDIVKHIISVQKEDGWISNRFHTAQTGTSDAAEPLMRLLCEKGLDTKDTVLKRALKIMEKEDQHFISYLDDHCERNYSEIDHSGLGGPLLIRATLFAQAGLECLEFVERETKKAIDVFNYVLKIKSFNEIIEVRRGKYVFKEGIKWPSLYHMRLLAYSTRWKTEENLNLVSDAFKNLIRILPFNDNIYFKDSKSQLVTPYGQILDALDTQFFELENDNWCTWFHRLELVSRMGIVNKVPVFKDMVIHLKSMIRENEGLFIEKAPRKSFFRWNAYSGLALEENWKNKSRRISDLTFRSLLILHYSKMDDSYRKIYD